MQAELARIRTCKGRSAARSSLSTFVTTAERAIAPESVALGVFGLLAALAALLIAAQMIGRQLHVGASKTARSSERRARARRRHSATVSSAWVGAIVVGAMLASVVAVGLSPLAPLGPGAPGRARLSLRLDSDGRSRRLDPRPRRGGSALAHRQAPHRRARRRRSHGSSGRAGRQHGIPDAAVTECVRARARGRRQCGAGAFRDRRNGAALVV